MKKKQFTRHLCILINPQVYEKVKEITDLKEISISHYLRIAIQEKLAKEISEPQENNF